MRRVNAEVVDAYHDPERCCNQGSIVKLHNGELVLGYNEERGKMHADTGRSCLIRSFDGGQSWDPSTRVVVEDYTEHTGNWDCAFAQVSDGTLIMHTRICGFISSRGAIANRIDEQAMHGRRSHQTGYAVFKSTDNGHTWNGPTPVTTYPIASSGTAYCLAGGTGSGHVVELPDGGLLMPLEGTLSADGYQGGGGVSWETSRCFLLRSDDDGDNWEHWGTMAYDPASIINFQEPSLTRMSNGRLVSMIRVVYRPARYDYQWVTHSEDDGVTWAPPQRTRLWGYPADLIQLHDGRVLSVNSYRARPMDIRGCTSEDGINWDPADEFIIADCHSPARDQHPQYWHIGYPTVVQLDDGTIVAAYHEYTTDGWPIQYMRTARFRLD